MTITNRDVAATVADAFPWQWAESWDNVGLVVGDPDAEVTGVVVALDADVSTIYSTVSKNASLLVTHHPPFLEVPSQVSPSTAPALYAALSGNIAIISAHTNLDRAPRAAGVLLDCLDLGCGRPLETSPASEGLLTIYVQEEAADVVRAALSDAGAGRIGLYRGCSFAGHGEGRFVPDATAEPTIGVPENSTAVPEMRIEAICPRAIRESVMAAARMAHPYEEPLITWVEIETSRGSVALGRITELEQPTPLSSLVELVAEKFDCTPRIWGSPDTMIAKVATGPGSAGSLIGAAAGAGADVLLAGEVRHHDALDAVQRGLTVIEAGHDVTEWPLVPILADAVRATPGLSGELLTVEASSRGWWTP